jgi:DNA ligase-1
MIIEETVLYMKDNTGAIRVWAISCNDDKITIRHGQVGGSMQYRTEHVAEGKAARSLEEQIVSRINSRISKQRDRGYTSDFDYALQNRPTNTLGMPKPMLAHKLKDVKDIDYTNAVVQPKFDGNRCIIYSDGITNRAYSRNGKPIEAIDHILDDLVLSEGDILDGELYCHGYPLQTIVSWIKRKQAHTLKLKYHFYDIVMDMPYLFRSNKMRNIIHGESIIPVYGDYCQSLEEAMMFFNKYRKQGYEGAILRWSDAGYEDGKRSKSLVKIKSWLDEEFLVIDIASSADNWAILICAIEGGATFRVSAPGSIPEKIEILANKDNYIGKEITVEFANYTKDGVPFHPVAKAFREPSDR